LDNALKFSDAPDPVILQADVVEDELRIDVVDRGVGLVSTDIPHIFERFRQVDGTSTRRHGGTGVGLYLSAQLVKVHGGSIWVDSTWGKGSTFSFSLPRQSTRTDVVTLQGQERRVS
jgi:signal transduction histidine kinase